MVGPSYAASALVLAAFTLAEVGVRGSVVEGKHGPTELTDATVIRITAAR